MIVFLIALFIMLVAAITTELIRTKRKKSLMNYMMYLNVIIFLGAVAFFFMDHDPIYMVIGMCFSVGVLIATFYKFTDF